MTLPQSREPTRGKNAASPSVPSVPSPSKADKYGVSEETHRGDAREKACVPWWIQEEEERRKRRAGELGLVARFSSAFGFVAIHDPTTGEWVEVEFKSAPSWAKNEAFRRKDLRKSGKSSDLNAREMEKPWLSEHAEPELEEPAGSEGEDRKAGLVYDEDLAED